MKTTAASVVVYCSASADRSWPGLTIVSAVECCSDFVVSYLAHKLAKIGCICIDFSPSHILSCELMSIVPEIASAVSLNEKITDDEREGKIKERKEWEFLKDENSKCKRLQLSQVFSCLRFRESEHLSVASTSFLWGYFFFGKKQNSTERCPE